MAYFVGLPCIYCAPIGVSVETYLNVIVSCVIWLGWTLSIFLCCAERRYWQGRHSRFGKSKLLRNSLIHFSQMQHYSVHV